MPAAPKPGRRTHIILLAGFALVTGMALRQASAQSHVSGLGSLPFADETGTGVAFRVWAPNATSVGVVGDFNGWVSTALATEGASGLWSGDVLNASVGQQYRYTINGTLLRRDPRGRVVTHSAGNSIIYDPDAFDWGGVEPHTPWKNDLVIYEMHAGTFYDPTPADGQPGKFTDAIAKLDHLDEMGVNCVELMPINEFPGEHSWGYNPADQFAVENLGYGGPNGLKSFVKACHERGIAVLLDIVHNHWGSGDLDLWEFDGWSGGGNGGGIYFYQDTSLCCTPWGVRPNFGRSEVYDFIKDQIRMWLDECRVDGFRWDVGYLLNHSGDGTFDPAGDAFIYDINDTIHNEYPGRISISESENMLMNFDAEWRFSTVDTLYPVLSASEDSQRDVQSVADHIGSAPGHTLVVYSESHDQVGDLNSGVRLPRRIDSGDPQSYGAKKRSMLGGVIVMTMGAMPMMFQGQEWLEDAQWGAGNPLDWNKAQERFRKTLFYSHLIRLRRNLDGKSQGLKGTGVNISHVNNGAKVIAYHRWDSGGTNDDVVVAINFSGTVWDDYTIPFPYAGRWNVHLNTDWVLYDRDFSQFGSNYVDAAGAPASASIQLAPYSAVIFSRADPVVYDADGDAILDPWELDHGLDPGNPDDAAENYDGDNLTNVEEYEHDTDPYVSNLLSDYASMAVPATFNGWNPTLSNMRLVDDYIWQWLARLENLVNPAFKFAANGGWGVNWGDDNPSGQVPPLAGDGDSFGADIQVSGVVSGDVLFTFNEQDLSYSMALLPWLDADGDGMHDAWEAFYGVDDPLGNPDGDALLNIDEYRHWSDPGQWSQVLSSYASMAVAGMFNGWDTAANPLDLVDNFQWEGELPFVDTTGTAFKFVANSNWLANNWGDDDPPTTLLPLSGEGEAFGLDIQVADTLHGHYKFQINELDGSYHVTRVRDGDKDGMDDTWELLFGLSPFIQDGTGDLDHDMVSNEEEFRADTVPTNPASFLHLSGLEHSTPGQVVLHWNGGVGATQYLMRAAPGASGPWSVVFTNLPPTGTNVVHTDAGPEPRSAWYRISVP